ncbi:FMN reductase [Kitasatospora sp. NPDC088391]|uniref:FMN reductase n=1 Tax=Kitasatospora sp. NPDC088391 TaxID=3364074 RepID=UPI0037F3717A
MTGLRLVVVTAGLSVPSSTRLLADRLAEATARDLRAAGREVDLRVVELRALARDIADNLVTGFPPPALRDALRAVEEADALIAVTPIFSASYSGLFKSFADVLDRDALTGKPVLIAATGGTARHSLALEHAMRPLFAYLRAAVVPTAVFAASEDWGANGADGSLAGRIDRAAGELATRLSGRPAGAVPPTRAAEQVVPFEQQLAALRVR